MKQQSFISLCRLRADNRASRSGTICERFLFYHRTSYRSSKLLAELRWPLHCRRKVVLLTKTGHRDLSSVQIAQELVKIIIILVANSCSGRQTVLGSVHDLPKKLQLSDVILCKRVVHISAEGMTVKWAAICHLRATFVSDS